MLGLLECGRRAIRRRRVGPKIMMFYPEELLLPWADADQAAVMDRRSQENFRHDPGARQCTRRNGPVEGRPILGVRTGFCAIRAPTIRTA